MKVRIEYKKSTSVEYPCYAAVYDGETRIGLAVGKTYPETRDEALKVARSFIHISNPPEPEEIEI